MAAQHLVLLSLQITTLSLIVLMHGAVVHGAPVVESILCSGMPYPRACKNLVSPDPSQAGNQSRLGSRTFLLRGATDRARRAEAATAAAPLGSLDPRSRAAWADCAQLAGDTVAKLQRSMTWASNEDSQTWLSAAAANWQTCLDGFAEFDMASHSSLPPYALDNATRELISNSLAINRAGMSPPPVSSARGGNERKLLTSNIGFPEWLSGADRRLLQAPSPKASADLVVAKDGSGNFRTISEAVNAAVSKSGGMRFIIYVKAGVYKENVQIVSSKKNLMLVGDGIGATVVTGKRNVVDGWTTFNSATVAVDGDGFIARDMTFENTAGAAKHQAVALRSSSDLSVFYRCSFKGYQDTLYVHTQRQFYRECDVYGTVDFIFGDAVVVLQNCNIFVRKPMSSQKNTVTAQGRTDPNENTGISIHNSRVTAAPDLRPVQGSFQTFLGRPWKQYSRTVFMKTSLDSLIAPAGWLEWSGDFALSTLYYGEYMNSGPGAGTSGRVKWPGYRVISSSAEASKFTVGSFLAGNSWLPGTGVPFTPGL